MCIAVLYTNVRAFFCPIFMSKIHKNILWTMKGEIYYETKKHKHKNQNYASCRCDSGSSCIIKFNLY